MGRIVAPYGVRGWVRVQPQTEQAEGLLSYGAWWIAHEAGWQQYRLVEGRRHGAGLVVRLDGLEDRDRAARMHGAQVAVSRSSMPPIEDGEYYWCDLIGTTVVNLQGVVLGRVAEIFATGANDVLVVRGERERLIPFIGSVVTKVELERGRMAVDWQPDF